MQRNILKMVNGGVLNTLRSRITYHQQIIIWSLLFVLPAFLILGLFRLTPILMSARLSFFDVNLLSQKEIFVGLDNFSFALIDKPFHNALAKTVVFVALKIPLQIFISLGLAILINRKIMGIGLFRTAPLMAVVMPMSIAAVIWTMMYHPSNGIINSVLASVGIPFQRFLTDKNQAMPSIVAMTLWKDAGFYMIIYLAGLQGIPEELYEASRVDGATGWDEFRYITLPMLRNTTTLVLILSTVFAFNVFIPIYVMTSGGPAGATEVVVYYMYKLGFKFYRLGYATTVTVITLVFALLISALQLRITKAAN